MNILDVKSGIIVHQVNTQGKMGAGLALQIRKAYPGAYELYKCACSDGRLELSKTQLIQLSPELYLANLAGQGTYGTGLHTDYPSLGKALDAVYKIAQGIGLPVFLPYRIGCGLGGGDWNVVEEIIIKHCPSAIICKL